MKSLHKGKLYLLENQLWSTINLKKIGCSKDVNLRIKSMSSALPDEVYILHQSSDLIDKYFYEHLLAKLLFKYRYKSNREFYQIDIQDYISIINSIETINKLYNDQESLLQFIRTYDKEYYNKRFGSTKTIESIKSIKSKDTNNKVTYSYNNKKKQKLFVDTSSIA